MNMKVSLNYQR